MASGRKADEPRGSVTAVGRVLTARGGGGGARPHSIPGMRLRLLLLAFSVGLVTVAAVAAASAAATAPARCTAHDLRAHAVFSTGAMNRELITIRFQNRRAPCELRGYAAVRPLDSHGHVVRAREQRTRQPFPGGRPFALRSTALARGKFAYFEFGYSNFDPVSDRTCTPSAENLRVAPPGATGTIDVNLRSDARRFAGLSVSRIGFCGHVFRVGPVQAARPFPRMNH